MAAGLHDRPGRRHLLRSFADLLAGWAVRLHDRRRLGAHPAPARRPEPDQPDSAPERGD